MVQFDLKTLFIITCATVMAYCIFLVYTIPNNFNIHRHDEAKRSVVITAQVNAMLISTAPPCIPDDRIVFLKTHKTGSSTLTSILQRYGYLRNLTFAVPKQSHIISHGYFMRTQVGSGKFDMLVNHVRFNKSEMQKVMKPNAKYITILRDPRTQLESVFGYFLLFKTLKLREADGFATFLSNPYYYYNKHSSGMVSHLRNPNLYDLGLQPNQQKNKTLVNLFIQRISREFDLVLINEYYNESLLLLKKLLCLSFDDILYIPKGIRSDMRRYTIANNERESINKWCWADALLYAHFNKTFWKRVREYGPTFQDDLRYFERKLKDTILNCTIANKMRDGGKHRASDFIMNPNGDKNCSLLMKSDKQFTSIIRARQTKKTKKIISRPSRRRPK